MDRGKIKEMRYREKIFLINIIENKQIIRRYKTDKNEQSGIK